MKISRKKLTTSVILCCSLLFVGCAVKPVTKPNKVNVEEASKYEMMKKPSEKRIKLNYVDLSDGKSAKVAFEQLSQIEEHPYILDERGANPYFNKSSYKGANNFKKLIKYLKETSNGLYDCEIKNKYHDKEYSLVYCFDKYEKNRTGLQFEEFDFSTKEKNKLSYIFNKIEDHTGFNVVPGDRYILKRYQEDTYSNYHGENIKGFLDFLSLSNNFFYDIDYKKKIIHVYQYKTKIYPMAIRNETVNIDNSITLTGQNGGTSGSEGNGKNSISIKSENDPIAELTASLKSLFAKDPGTTPKPLTDDKEFNVADYEEYNILASNGKVIITAAPSNFKKAEERINQINDSYTKNVYIRAMIYKITYTNTKDWGVNYSILSKLADSEGWSLNALGNNGLSKATELTEKGSISFIDISDKRKFSAIINSLHDIGNTEISSNFEILTQNNVLGVDFSRTSKPYIDKMSQETIDATDTQAGRTTFDPTQKDLSYGDLLLVTPRIINNKIHMNMYLKFDTLVDLEKVSYGDADSNLFLQQPEVDDTTKKISFTIGNKERYIIGGKIKTKKTRNHSGILPTNNIVTQSLLGDNGRVEEIEEYLIVVDTEIQN